MLILSGGGSNGAWGAGYLVGWGQQGTRPKFDLVTGISTGALMATGAFIGDDDFLTRAYTATANGDVQRDRWWIELPFSDSLKSTAPLVELLKRFLTDAVIAQVAAGAAEHRKLYVASTDLNTGKLVIWDLTRVAADGHPNLYRQIVLSSASAPVLYPPVRIGSDLFADGGVRASLFYRKYLLPLGSPAGVPNIYAINNGSLGLAPDPSLDDAIFPIGLRSVECLLDATGYDSLYQLRLVGGKKVKVTSIPEGLTHPASFDFDTAAMRKLFEAGRAEGAAGTWHEPPDPNEAMKGN